MILNIILHYLNQFLKMVRRYDFGTLRAIIITTILFYFNRTKSPHGNRIRDKIDRVNSRINFIWFVKNIGK